MIDLQNIEVLDAGLGNILNSPNDDGRLEMIVVRPQKKQRETREACLLTRAQGVDGDHWSRGCWKKLADGSPDPDVQIAIMNSRCLDLLATSKERWPLAGDNLIVDMDLSTTNLPPGQRLSLGEVILEITAVPHTGCKYFSERYGVDAVKFVSTPKAKDLRLRGVYARVIRDGVVKVGERVKKVKSEK
jgi:hypothetical protein